jgi:hypothetical protein
MLWEGQFYEDGVSIADRISALCKKVDNETIHSYAIEARQKMKLRHVPLLLAKELTQNNYKNIAQLLNDIIQRPDEITEFLSIYWKEGKRPIPNQVKIGLGNAFKKFDEYQLAKWNKKAAIKLRDAMRLCHPKPDNKEQEQLFGRLIKDSLAVPYTWETVLSEQSDLSKKQKWENLLKSKKLGALALLRNLRNMDNEQISDDFIIESLSNINTSRILPFRFIEAAKYVPRFESYLEKAMIKCLSEKEKMEGETILLIDVSGSMDSEISSKSNINRLDAACGLAILLREISQKIRIFTFSEELAEVPTRHGFALSDAVNNSQMHGGTYLGGAMSNLNRMLQPCDRLIVITDEQSHDTVSYPSNFERSYMINVASYKNGVGYGKWLHIDGWSEHVIDYIQELEKEHR